MKTFIKPNFSDLYENYALFCPKSHVRMPGWDFKFHQKLSLLIHKTAFQQNRRIPV